DLLPGWPAPGLSALDPRARYVASVRLEPGPTGRGPAHQPVLRLAGVEPPPSGTADLGPNPGDGAHLARCHLPPPGRWPHIRTHRQRAPRAHGPVRGRALPEPRAGGSWPALRRPDADLYARGPGDEGRLGGHGPDSPGRPGPDRVQPAGELQQLRRAG